MEHARIELSKVGNGYIISTPDLEKPVEGSNWFTGGGQRYKSWYCATLNQAKAYLSDQLEPLMKLEPPKPEKKIDGVDD